MVNNTPISFPLGLTLVVAGTAPLPAPLDPLGFYRVTRADLDRAWWSGEPEERTEQQRLRDVLPVLVLQPSLLRSHLGTQEEPGVLYFSVRNRLSP